MPNQISGGWESINWTTVQYRITKLQKMIYKNALEGNILKVRKLQNTLLIRYDSKLLAVRRVTQDNRGKKTAGIDKISSLDPEQRKILAGKLSIDGKSSPLRRIEIPKPGKNEKRPLGIPTIEDRAKQALVHLALEPEWEAYFEPNSYGFRPGRNCHDAISQIRHSIVRSPKYVLDADISKCFDRINHEYLIGKLKLGGGKMEQQIKAWLKTGYIVFPSTKIEETTTGTPQGGVISPLLANIALHGLETHIKEHVSKIPQFFQTGKKITSDKDRKSTVTIVRYVDDFVVMHPNKEILESCKKEVENFLTPIGLELSKYKTRLTHTLHPEVSENKKAGFQFLGFSIIQYKTRLNSIRSTIGKSLGFRTYILPSTDSWREHLKKVSKVIERIKEQELLIKKLNPIISGWARYFGVSDVYVKRNFQRYDNIIYSKLLRWSTKIIGTRRGGFEKYWNHNGKRWNFGKEIFLSKYLDNAGSILKYVKVKGVNSIYDDNSQYWEQRLFSHPKLSQNRKKLLRKQKGLCTYCKRHLNTEDIMENHHIIPQNIGGKNTRSNLQLIHGYCHDKIHASKHSDMLN
jgi:RNA-directed DNA polymerase